MSGGEWWQVVILLLYILMNHSPPPPPPLHQVPTVQDCTLTVPADKKGKKMTTVKRRLPVVNLRGERSDRIVEGCTQYDVWCSVVCSEDSA